MKRKSLGRLKTDLRTRLWPEVDLATLANEIRKVIGRHVDEAKRNLAANNLAVYLKQKYLVTNTKSGELYHLIEHHAEDLSDLLDQVRFKEYQFLFRTLSKNADQLPRRKKKARVRPQTEAERVARLKDSKNRYDERRREYRDGLIEEQFGIQQIPTFDPNLTSRPTGPCLDILFSGGTVKMCGCSDSFENLFGIDRHRFPKSLRGKRSGRNVVYGLKPFLKCLVQLLENRSGSQQWLPEPSKRGLVLTGIIERAQRFSPKTADILAAKLRPYLS